MPSQQILMYKQEPPCFSRDVAPFRKILILETEVDDVFQKYFRYPFSNHSLDINCDIYEMAKKMDLDKEEMWYKLVYTFSPIRHLQNFIFDTMSFITKGVREVSIENWMRLVDLEYKHVIILKDWSFKPIELPLKDSDILSDWVSNEKGIYDMLFSMKILVKTSLAFIED